MESNESTEQWLASRQHDLPPVIVRLRYPPNKRCIAPPDVHALVVDINVQDKMKE